MASALSVADLTVRFGGLTAVSGVNLAVENHGRLGIIGPNGAGKSTLFYAITGRVRPAAGRLVVDEHEVTHWPTYRRAASGIVQTFQNIQLFGSLSVLENAMVGGHLRAAYPAVLGFFRLPRVRRVERTLAEEARTLLRRFELVGVEGRRVSELPYAMQKRVEVARALMARPRVLLLDEPATGMNDYEKGFFVEAVREMQSALGFALVVIEHDVVFLARLVERMVAMSFGQIIAQGNPESVMATPAVVESYTG
ncbi:ABC transporter ATP-binding protein [bacterium]|nr:MAG: ABC transporter ATP-binding protein [bacterium]